ncbi:glycerophosphodiester phosphodiesterase [Lysinibacillus yapensis]|uniref:Glycerophosphodiester phosphodiesterase n=1 Tax=Ureibacillus yapensis TaxID=2304605 RepID=A0A396S6K3_9BACL|nr:glycerophosphodiester phosphodiesterase family protein [Lysinibacillus yapensis]RHW36292.1 glycerophosphodiester phosphodiesterase [Lysinibacillus yapensis]
MHKKQITISIIMLFLIVAVFWFVEVENIEAEPGIVEIPKIFAHRGAVDRFNESTITSYKIASGEKVDALELDLRMTKDGKLIVMHDETIDRTTNGSGKVSEITLKEVKSYETVGEYNNRATKEKVPTLEEVFQTFGSSQNYYIETRLVDGKTLMEEELVQLLAKYNLLHKKKVAIQSFSEESLKKMGQLAPQLRLTLLFKRGHFNLDKALAVDFPVIGLESSDATVKTVNALHSKGKEVHVFFNHAEKMKEQQAKMKELNVDGYFTDDISYTKQLLNSIKQ